MMYAEETSEQVAFHLNQKAEEYFESGNLDEAYTICLEVLETLPLYPLTCKTLGDIFQAQGNLSEAMHWYDKALTEQPDWAEIYGNLGNLYAKQNELSAAIFCYHKSLDLQPLMPGIYRNLAKIYEQVGQLNMAEEFRQKSQSVEMEKAIYDQIDLANQSLQSDDLAGAIASYEKAIEMNPYLPNLYEGIAPLYEKQKDSAKLISCYEKLTELSPERGEYWQRLGNLLVETSAIKQAVEALQKAVELLPNIAWVNFHLAAALQKAEDLPGAIAYFQKAAELNPQLWNAFYRWGQCLNLDKQYEAAIQVLEKAKDINPEMARIYISLGEAYYHFNCFDQAIITYEKVTELEPGNWISYAKLADALIGDKQYERAIAILQTLEEKQPELGGWLPKKIADTLTANGNYQEAVAYYEKAISQNPQGYWIYFALAENYEKAGELELAVRTVLRVLQTKPDHAIAYQKIAYFLNQQGETSDSFICQNNLFPLNILEKHCKFPSIWALTSNTPTPSIKKIPIYNNGPVDLTTVYTIESELHSTLTIQQVTAPSVFVTQVQNGKGWGDEFNSAVMNPDHRLIIDISSGSPELILTSPYLPTVKKLEGKVAFLSSRWGNIYFHWLFDVVARCGLLTLAGIEWDSINYFVVNGQKKRFQAEILGALGLPSNKIITSEEYPYIQADELLIPSFSFVGGDLRTPYWACDFLQKSLSPQPAVNTSRKRLYISRSQASWRKVINETEVINFLTNYGFTVVNLENMSFQEQVEYMASAEVVIAPHGSGLTNILFCPAGTTIIEIFSPNFISNIYWHLASSCQLIYCYMLGEDVAAKPNIPPQKQDISINLDRLLVMLQYVRIAA
ncbi:MAG: tetratricopeptide repeat protein [Microcoleaceae cyanobacterium]